MLATEREIKGLEDGWKSPKKTIKDELMGKRRVWPLKGRWVGKVTLLKKMVEKMAQLSWKKEWERIKNLNFKSHLEKNIRLYELNMRTWSFPPGESSWRWLTRGLFCFLGRSWIVMLIFCRPSAQCWVWMERVLQKGKIPKPRSVLESLNSSAV